MYIHRPIPPFTQSSKWKFKLLVRIKFLNLFFYSLVIQKTEKFTVRSEQSFTGLGPEDWCSSWGLFTYNLFLYKLVFTINHCSWNSSFPWQRPFRSNLQQAIFTFLLHVFIVLIVLIFLPFNHGLTNCYSAIPQLDPVLKEIYVCHSSCTWYPAYTPY